MGIEKIKGNVETLSGQKVSEGKILRERAYITGKKDSVSFTGAAVVPKTLKEVLLDLMPRSIKGMVKAHKGMGEVQNQAINAMGTAFVAPVFIKYNPLSDTDEDTRSYTAWRQPVSAILAMCTQCAIVIPFDRAIKRMSDIGYEHFSLQYNASLFPSDKFIEKAVVAANKGKKLSKDEMKIEVEKLKAKYSQELKDMISDDKIEFKKVGRNGISTEALPKDDFKNLFEETIDALINDERAERDRLLTENHKYKIRRAVFYYEHPEKSRILLDKLSENLEKIYTKTSQGFDQEVGSVSKDACKRFNKACEQMIDEIKKDTKTHPENKEVNKTLINMVKEVKSRNIDDASTSRVLKEKILKMQNSLTEMSSKASVVEVNQAVTDKVNCRAKAIDDLLKVLQEIKDKLKTSGITVKEAQEILDEKRIEAENKLLEAGKKEGKDITSARVKKEILDSAEDVSTRIRNKIDSLAGQIGDQMKKHVTSNVDALKRWTGLFVSLAILPATCWMLNRIYPWFMAKVFPDLTNSKNKAKEAQDAETKKVEVA